MTCEAREGSSPSNDYTRGMSAKLKEFFASSAAVLSLDHRTVTWTLLVCCKTSQAAAVTEQQPVTSNSWRRGMPDNAARPMSVTS